MWHGKEGSEKKKMREETKWRQSFANKEGNRVWRAYEKQRNQNLSCICTNSLRWVIIIHIYIVPINRIKNLKLLMNGILRVISCFTNEDKRNKLLYGKFCDLFWSSQWIKGNTCILPLSWALQNAWFTWLKIFAALLHIQALHFITILGQDHYL